MTRRQVVTTAAMAVIGIALGGCISRPPRYQYHLYTLQATGSPTKADEELWNSNGEIGWRIVGVINEKYLILEREY